MAEETKNADTEEKIVKVNPAANVDPAEVQVFPSMPSLKMRLCKLEEEIDF